MNDFMIQVIPGDFDVEILVNRKNACLFYGFRQGHVHFVNMGFQPDSKDEQKIRHETSVVDAFGWYFRYSTANILHPGCLRIFNFKGRFTKTFCCNENNSHF